MFTKKPDKAAKTASVEPWCATPLTIVPKAFFIPVTLIKPGKTNWRTRLLILGLCVFVLLALLVAAAWLKLASEDRAARLEIQKQLAAIHAAGQPLTGNDLAKLYPDPPPERDAALLLKPALAALTLRKDSTNLPFWGGSFPIGNAPLDKPMLAEIQTWADKNRPVLDLVPWEKLSGAWIGVGYPAALTNFHNTNLENLNPLAKGLCQDAMLEAELQHPHAAALDLQHALMLGTTLKNGVPIHSMIRFIIEARVCNSLNRVLNTTALTDHDLMTLPALFSDTNRGAAKDIMMQERCLGLFMADKLRSQIGRPPHAILPLGWLIHSYRDKFIYRDQDLLNYLDWNDRYLAVLDQPLSNGIPAILAFESANDAFVKRHPPSFLNTFRKNRVSFLALSEPDLSAFLRPEGELVAHVRVTCAALAVERWRLANGHQVPDSLAELVPGILSSMPTDPFDGRPLRYKKLARGYVIYSLGPDFIDDGGKAKPADAADSAHYDITFDVDR